MALTELQLPSKDSFYSNLRQIANEMRRMSERWEAVSDFIANVETADLDAMGVPTGQVRTDLVNLRKVLVEFNQFFAGESVTPTNNPKEVVDAIRHMNVI